MTLRRAGLAALLATALGGLVVPLFPRTGRAARFPGPLDPSSRLAAALNGPSGGARIIPIGNGSRVGLPSRTAQGVAATPDDATPGEIAAREVSRKLAERESDLRRMGIHHMRSPRNLLSPVNQARVRAVMNAAARGPASRGLFAAPDGETSLFADGDTLYVRLAAIRIEFNEYDNATSGRFDLRSLWDPDRNDTLLIDPPPHDRAYYLQAYRALDSFWQAMFYGHLKLEYQVFPLSDSGAYTLDSLTAYAHIVETDSLSGISGRAGGWTVDGILKLVKDCLAAADADTAWRFQDYDVYNIIHAGPDFQTDVNRDSPDDIPSLYAYFGDTLWTDVTATDSFPVIDATLLPETVSQDGLVGGINGVMAHEFGHQLGLPDFYDVFTGFPAVGYWELMDSGPNLAVLLGYQDQSGQGVSVPVFGILPGELSAYSRYFLSTGYYGVGALSTPFLNVVDVPTTWSDSLPPVEMPPGAGPGTVLRVPMTAEEYYLIENRQDDSDGNRARLATDEFGTPLLDHCGRDSLEILEGVTHYTGADTLVGALYQEKTTGFMLGPSRFVPRECDTIPPFEEVRSWEYDVALPGHGLLVWHVDEAVIFDLGIGEFGWAVNADRNRRGLSLVEADGIPDLGDWRSFYWQGSAFDPYYAGNADSLTPNSFPSTLTNLGGETGLRITGVGPRGHFMHFAVDRGVGEPGFPLFLSVSGERGSAGSAAATADVDGDGVSDVVVARGGRVFVVRGGIAPNEVLPGFPAESGDAELGPVSLGDMDGDGRPELAARTGGGKLAAWRNDGTPFFGASNPYAAPVFTDSLSAKGGPPFLTDLDGDGHAELIAGAGHSLRAWQLDGGSTAVLWSVPSSRLGGDPRADVIAVADGSELAPGSAGRVLALLTTGEVALVDAGGNVIQRWAIGRGDFSGDGWMASGNIDRASDDALEVLVAGADGTVALLEAGGTLAADHWPVSLGAAITGPPALGDVDGDGRLEAAIALDGIGVAVLRSNGAPLTGSPFRAPVASHAAPVIADLQGDGPAEVLVNGSDGLMYGFDAAGKALAGWPVGMGREPLAAGAFGNLDGDPAPELAGLDGIGALAVVGPPGWADAGRVEWAEAYGDAARGSRFAGTLAGVTNPGVFASESGVYVYPNPARGANPRIRISLGSDADVLVRIFSLAGGEVVSWRGRMAEPVDEFEWNASQVSSGLYVAKIELRGAGQTMRFTRKIALIR